MKNNIQKLVKWFCRHLTFNELASAVPVLLEVLSGKRKDIDLKPESDKPPHYRDFRVDTEPPLEVTESEDSTLDWQHLLKKHLKEKGKALQKINHKKLKPPPGCRCRHCNAPRSYLWINNGKLATQVLCKICGKTSPTHKTQRQSKAKYLCPFCEKKLFNWKESESSTAWKCGNKKCPHFLKKKSELTEAESENRKIQKYDPNYKLHYQYREYHIDYDKLKTARPEEKANVDLNKIHNNHHVVGLVLTFMVNLGLSSRVTRNALKGLFDIDISHQTVINYTNAAAAKLASFVDKNSPAPSSIAAADETYIIVEKLWHYTWFIIDSATRALCGYTLSNKRNTESALAVIVDAYGKPDKTKSAGRKLITDGNPSYDSAVMAYNKHLEEDHMLKKNTVIGLQNIDKESAKYREFKQLIERLNRTYKYHTRPRAGFKSFGGAVALTTLFVAYYNFMRPHMALKNNVPVKLDCLKKNMLMPEAWVTLLNQAA